MNWKTLQPDTKNNWITEGLYKGFADFLPIGSKDVKAAVNLDVQAIFKTYSPGVMTGRDNIVYDFKQEVLAKRIQQQIEDYNTEILRWKTLGKPKEIDAFVSYDKVKWSEHLKNQLQRLQYAEFDKSHIRRCLYRPYCKQYLYYDPLLNDRPGLFNSFLPEPIAEAENPVIVFKVGAELPMFALMVGIIPDRQPQTGSQCFPLYTYALDGKLRRDNITDWALAQFQEKYGPGVTKRDIFHYVYALLHHPEYRERYKENLKRELPRIPLVESYPGSLEARHPSLEGRGDEGKIGPPQEDIPSAPSFSTLPSEGRVASLKRAGVGPSGADLAAGIGVLSPFQTFVDIGAKLAALHVGYEEAEEYPLTQVVSKDVPFSWRVTKMRLNAEKTSLKVNESLTLAGIPGETLAYRLGNRSALEWVIDQYQVTTDKRSGIGSDPNRADEPDYIARLVGRVVTVSVETVKLVAALPPLGIQDAA